MTLYPIIIDGLQKRSLDGLQKSRIWRPGKSWLKFPGKQGLVLREHLRERKQDTRVESTAEQQAMAARQATYVCINYPHLYHMIRLRVHLLKNKASVRIGSAAEVCMPTWHCSVLCLPFWLLPVLVQISSASVHVVTIGNPRTRSTEKAQNQANSTCIYTTLQSTPGRNYSARNKPSTPNTPSQHAHITVCG